MANLLRYRLGFALRETGQALERVGCLFQGINSYEEEITRHRTVANAGPDHVPSVSPTAFLAPNAAVVGDVALGARASVWYGAALRGDRHAVRIGADTNIQDGSCVGTLSPSGGPTTVGRGVSVGHGAVLRGCTIGDGALVGMNAVVCDGATVEPGAMVAAGAVVADGATVPAGELWGGNPARKLRAMRPEEARYLRQLPEKYVALAAQHAGVVAYLRARMEGMPAGVGAVRTGEGAAGGLATGAAAAAEAPPM